METKEIHSAAWESFGNQLQEIRPRTRLTIERIESNSQCITVVNELELREARFNRTDACSDVINLTLVDADGEAVEYAITEPLHIKLCQKESDRYNTIEIIAEDGTHILSARPGFRPDLITDLVR